MLCFSFYTPHPHIHPGPPTIIRTDTSHTIINMNQHHQTHQEDSKDSLIVQQQVQHQQDLMEQHHQQQEMQQQDDEVSIQKLETWIPASREIKTIHRESEVAKVLKIMPHLSKNTVAMRNLPIIVLKLFSFFS